MSFTPNSNTINNTNDQVFSNISSTFDMEIQQPDDGEEFITPLVSVLGEKAPAVSFTFELFRQRPDLFGVYAASLIYAQYSGTSYKPDTVYSIFEMFMRRYDKKLILAKRTRVIGPYEFDPDLLITWAKIMQNSKMFIIFEPVMNNLNKVMNTWLSNRKVTYGGIEYDIKMFRPLCYTRSGECFFSLLPYICYICTFMIHCRPFTFNEAQTESSTYGFYKSLNDYYQLNYTALGQDYGINIIKSSMNELKKIPENYFVDLFKTMLHPDKIIQIRNREMERTPELLNECITDQNGLSYEYVSQAWSTTLTQLLKRIITYSPIKTIFDSIPRFKSNNNLNIHELLMWTQYCLADGDKPFCIESEHNSQTKSTQTNYSFMLHADPASIKQLPTALFSKQSLKTNIKSLTVAKGMPFCSNDLVLEMATAYLGQKLDVKMNDILDDDPIKIDESLLRDSPQLYDKPLAEVIRNLFVNGLWMYDNSSMASALNQLLTNSSFVQEISDILSLSTLTQITYDNRLASIIISTYVISYLNDWLLHTCNNEYPLKYFSPYTYLVSLPPSGKRIAKLLDITISLLYLSTSPYTSFVNSTMKEFQDIMVLNPIIQQPYVKGLADMADIYAIGGCDLYNYAKYANPLIRGYGWVSNVYGSCESLETLYQWLVPVQNNALMELLESSLNNVSNIEMNLKVQWAKLFATKTYPNILANFTFGSGNYKFKNYPYALDLKANDGKSLLSIICSRTFPRSYATQSTEMNINFKQLKFVSNSIQANRSSTNSITFNGQTISAKLTETGNVLRIPVYNFEGRMEDVKVTYIQPPSYRLITLTILNSRNRYNQTILLFTTAPVQTRFQKYELPNEDVSPQSATILTDRLT